MAADLIQLRIARAAPYLFVVERGKQRLPPRKLHRVSDVDPLAEQVNLTARVDVGRRHKKSGELAAPFAKGALGESPADAVDRPFFFDLKKVVPSRLRQIFEQRRNGDRGRIRAAGENSGDRTPSAGVDDEPLPGGQVAVIEYERAENRDVESHRIEE